MTKEIEYSLIKFLHQANCPQELVNIAKNAFENQNKKENECVEVLLGRIKNADTAYKQGREDAAVELVTKFEIEFPKQKEWLWQLHRIADEIKEIKNGI